MFRMHEHVRAGGSRDRDRMARDVARAAPSRSPTRSASTRAADVASDPFFGRGGKLLADSQRDQRLKLEIVAPIASDEQPDRDHLAQLPPGSFRRAHSASTTADGAVAHTACVGFGLERIALALYRRHGFDRAQWPAPVREALDL